jgi:hypothetical protein
MSESKLYEAVANLVLQSISVWEELHLYALSYSAEYNTFWGLLDDNLKAAVCSVRKRNRLERLLPFSMGLIGYYRNIVTRDSFQRIHDVHWKKQLKTILTDKKFQAVMSRLNYLLQENRRREYRSLRCSAAVSGGNVAV